MAVSFQAGASDRVADRVGLVDERLGARDEGLGLGDERGEEQADAGSEISPPRAAGSNLRCPCTVAHYGNSSRWYEA